MLICQSPAYLLPMNTSWASKCADLDARAQAHPWKARQIAEGLETAGYAGEVLVRAGELLGFYLAMKAADEGHLLCISVDPAHQGQGHGLCLMEAFIAWARTHFLSSLWLEVRVSNSGAMRLYERLGFERVGKRKDYYQLGKDQREDALVMCRLQEHSP